MDVKQDTEAKTILDAGRALNFGRPVENPNPESRAFAIVPADCKLEYLERTELPPRKRGIIKLDDAGSFIRYFNTNGDGEKNVYASLAPAAFVGILNDHNPSPTDPANWRDFGCKYALEHSNEWKVWTGRNKQPFDGNEAFAYWLEDNLADVKEPDNGKLLEIAVNFRVHSNASFQNQVRLNDGNTEFAYTNAVEGSSTAAGGKVKIPERIVIEVPVFQGRNAKLYKVEARFRFRLNGGALKISYELVRPHKVVEQAFNDMVDLIEAETKQPVLYGTP